ncbi:hypothetical protein [Ruminiclostridium papyrosolvens]|uniref:Uncharacterized protein n=1 Tax=Ruminiclostridium papyrosolvens C7 TaxID=1330534 RepID=U4QYW6_9FIRM|nr:hypothetical protein [Ruminiclostridium papyrosolvens]EPR09185.1 hypothetical protein L323_16560 [Ruminiclostridium papyrosolvens C7]
MICPKCKIEYEKGYTKCSDCHIDLVERVDVPQHVYRISQIGLSMLKFGIALLFVGILELLTLITLNDANIIRRTYGGGPGEGILSELNPVARLLIYVQFIICLMVIIYGFFSKERN